MDITMDIKGMVMKPKRLAMIVGGLLLACTIGIVAAIPGKEAVGEAPRRLPAVVTVPVAPEKVEEVFTVPGTVESWQESSLGVERAGIVRWIGVTDGDVVTKGTPVLKVSADSAGSDLEKEAATMELRQKDLERTRTLFEGGAVSQKDLDDAENAYRVARAGYESAAADLSHTTLTSPMDGVIDQVHVRLGEYATPGQPLADIVQVDRLKVEVEVSERDVASIAVGDDVIIEETLPGDTPGRFPGTVGHVAYRADTMSRTYRVVIHLDVNGSDLRPGTIVRTRFTRKQWDDAMLVPMFAVSDSGGVSSVLVYEDGYARPRPVSLGPVIGSRVIVKTGLLAGDELIVTGHQFLAGNERVAREQVQ